MRVMSIGNDFSEQIIINLDIMILIYFEEIYYNEETNNNTDIVFFDSV